MDENRNNQNGGDGGEHRGGDRRGPQGLGPGGGFSQNMIALVITLLVSFFLMFQIRRESEP